MIAAEGAMSQSNGTYSIKVVARMTGLSPDVIRAWERRYGAIVPPRAERGIRLYRDQDVKRLLLLKEAIASGHAIGRLASVSDAELAAMIARSPSAVSAGPSPLVERIISAIARLDYRAADEALGEAAALLPPSTLLAEVVQPLLTHVGETWSYQPLGIAREHLTTALLRHLLGTLLRTRHVDRQLPTVILGTLPGELHEMGLLMVGLLIASHGVPVCYFGPNLPPSELAGAAVETKAEIVGLSLARVPDAPQLAALEALAEALAPHVMLWLGGEGAQGIPAERLPKRVSVFASLDEMERRLGSLLRA